MSQVAYIFAAGKPEWHKPLPPDNHSLKSVNLDNIKPLKRDIEQYGLYTTRTDMSFPEECARLLAEGINFITNLS